MFGFVYSILGLSAKAILDFKNAVEDEECKQKFKIDDDMYIDHAGVTRIICNNHPTVTQTMPNGERVIIDCKTGKIYRNLSSEEIFNEFEERQKQDLKITVIKVNGDKHPFDKIKGYRYKDIKSGEIYVKQFIDGHYFYTSIETGIVIRPADEEYDKYPKYKEELLMDIIEKENKFRGIFPNLIWNRGKNV